MGLFWDKSAKWFSCGHNIDSGGGDGFKFV